MQHEVQVDSRYQGLLSRLLALNTLNGFSEFRSLQFSKHFL
jgi:hypothetical protein